MKTNLMFAALMTGVMAFNCAALAQVESKPEKTEQSEQRQEKKREKARDRGDKASTPTVKVGDAAPEFKLTDTDGKEHTLSELTKSGKIVVIQWFNAQCPFVKKHYGDAGNTFNDIHTKYASKDVMLVAINSSADGMQGSGTKLNAQYKTDWKIEYPILMDPTGETGKAYGAKNTPAMYIVGKDGKIAYMGAIDDDSGADKPGKTNYVTNALDQMLAGETVSTPSTRPYGCSVKYKK